MFSLTPSAVTPLARHVSRRRDHSRRRGQSVQVLEQTRQRHGSSTATLQRVKARGGGGVIAYIGGEVRPCLGSTESCTWLRAHPAPTPSFEEPRAPHCCARPCSRPLPFPWRFARDRGALACAPCEVRFHPAESCRRCPHRRPSAAQHSMVSSTPDSALTNARHFSRSPMASSSPTISWSVRLRQYSSGSRAVLGAKRVWK